MNLQIPNPRGFARWREKEREKEKKMVDAITLASGHYYVSCRIISPRVLPDLISFVRNSAPSGKACMQHEIQECAMRIYLLRPCKALQGDRCGHFFFCWKKAPQMSTIGWKRALCSFWLMFNMRQVDAIFILVTFATCYNRRLRNIRMEGAGSKKMRYVAVGEEF